MADDEVDDEVDEVVVDDRYLLICVLDEIFPRVIMMAGVLSSLVLVAILSVYPLDRSIPQLLL